MIKCLTKMNFANLILIFIINSLNLLVVNDSDESSFGYYGKKSERSVI